MTIEEALRLGAETLSAMSDTARMDSECLLTLSLDVQRSHLYAWPDQALSEQQCEQFTQLLTRRFDGEPIAYIRGWQEFWSQRFEVGPGVLIPRPETELLVEQALTLNLREAAVLDLGTGSGCIALSLAAERCQWQITAADQSVDALAYAKRNRERQLAANVEMLRSDWFAQLGNGEFDLIISNPPYVAVGDKHLEQGDAKSEPLSALAAGPQGLDDIAHIVRHAGDYLKSGGTLMLEHGFDQAEAVVELLRGYDYRNIQQYKDLQCHIRVTAAQTT